MCSMSIFLSCAGVNSWSMHELELPYPDTLDKYKLFAQFLLQGKVHCSETIVVEGLLYSYFSLEVLVSGGPQVGRVHSLPAHCTSDHGEILG